MNPYAKKPTIREHLHWFFHPQYTLIEVRRHDGHETSTVTTSLRMALRLAFRSKAIYWMLFRRTAYGPMDRLILESYDYDTNSPSTQA